MPDDNKPETPPNPGNLPEEVTKVLEDIKAKLENPGPVKEDTPAPVAPSYNERRAELQKKLGFNDEQMSAHEEMIMRAQAPVIESSGWSKLEKKSDLDTYRAEIEKELSIYPQEKRTPEIMEKIYFYVKGRHADSKPTTSAGPAGGSRVADTRVSRGPGYSGSDPGLGGGAGGGEGPGKEEELTDQEKFVASKLGISEKDYGRSKQVGKHIRELRVPDQRQASSMADVELRRLQGAR